MFSNGATVRALERTLSFPVANVKLSFISWVISQTFFFSLLHSTTIWQLVKFSLPSSHDSSAVSYVQSAMDYNGCQPLKSFDTIYWQEVSLTVTKDQSLDRTPKNPRTSRTL